jgi:hypothetical protein
MGAMTELDAAIRAKLAARVLDQASGVRDA